MLNFVIAKKSLTIGMFIRRGWVSTGLFEAHILENESEMLRRDRRMFVA